MTNALAYPDLLPSYEHERLDALQAYQVLGTPGQGLFNDFVGLVAKLFDTPIALVSLVRADDVVFVGNEGLLEADIVNREDSLCSVAILRDGPAIFEDLGLQPCTLVNPFAAQQLRLVFYAGQALRTPEGLPIGTLCVIDRRARRLSPAEGNLLKQLALVAETLLRLQARSGADQAASLRERLDGPLRQSLTRLGTLAELRRFASPEEAEDARLDEARVDEALYLAKTLHRELQAALVEA